MDELKYDKRICQLLLELARLTKINEIENSRSRTISLRDEIETNFETRSALFKYCRVNLGFVSFWWPGAGPASL